MKKIIVFTTLIILSSQSFGQQTDKTTTVHDRAFYMEKSKKQKNTAWLFLAVGVATAGVAGIIGASSVCIGCAQSEGPKASSIMAIIGGAMTVTSIPFFISSASNKNKAKNLSAFFRLDHIPFATPGTFAKISSPTLSLRLRFN